jgi:peptidoglycan/LPS O-acetylase OafA/YrhL
MRRAELPALTGVRFYASLLVLLYHLPQIIPGMSDVGVAALFASSGDIGVAFFFVLSGFVLTFNYSGLFSAGVAAPDYKRFIWARLTKIYPVHLLTLLLVLPISLLSPQTPFDWRAIPVHLTLLQCFWPWSTPRFSDNLNKPSWSISCEWFFYLLAPLAMYYGVRGRPRYVPVALTAVSLLGLGLFLWNGQSDITRLYFVSRFAPSRFLEFLAGIFVCSVFLISQPRLAAWSGAMQTAGVALIAAGGVFAPRAPWPLLGGGLLYLPGSLLLILGLAYQRGFLSAHLSHPVLKILGTASFSLYMIHHPILRVTKGIFLKYGWAVESAGAFWLVTAVMFVIAQAAALAICYGYEIPVQNWLRRRPLIDKAAEPLRVLVGAPAVAIQRRDRG